MRVALIVAAAAACFTACVNFGLDDRRYRCDSDPDICGDGWSCVAGYCEPDGAGGADAAADEEPEPAACGSDAGTVCDDENPCTDDECSDAGECVFTARPDNTPCGDNCVCEDGEPTEGRPCPEQCSTQQSCCPDGTCRPTC